MRLVMHKKSYAFPELEIFGPFFVTEILRKVLIAHILKGRLHLFEVNLFMKLASAFVFSEKKLKFSIGISRWHV